MVSSAIYDTNKLVSFDLLKSGIPDAKSIVIIKSEKDLDDIIDDIMLVIDSEMFLDNFAEIIEKKPVAIVLLNSNIEKLRSAIKRMQQKDYIVGFWLNFYYFVRI